MRRLLLTLLLLLPLTLSDVRAQDFDLFGLLDRGAGLDERFDAARLEELKTEWITAPLQSGFVVRLSKQPGRLVLEAPPETGAVAVTNVPGAASDIDVTFTRWSGTQPVAGLVWGNPGTTHILMLALDGGFSLSGCDRHTCWDDAYGVVPYRAAPGTPVRLRLRRIGGELQANTMELSIDGDPVMTLWTDSGAGPASLAGVYAAAGTTVEMDRVTVRDLEASFDAAPPEALDGHTVWVHQREDGQIETLLLGIAGSLSAGRAAWASKGGPWRGAGRYAQGPMTVLQRPEGSTNVCTRLRAGSRRPYETQCFQLVRRAPGTGEPAQTCFLDPAGAEGPLGCYTYRTDATGDVLYDQDGGVWTRATFAGQP